ncbi:L-methionine/D-methionine ABC transporter membrane anchored binding protein [Pararobbsia alpina]|jgi:D-methionine transport system substrate-binding protein|uniref:MetQ/NlpA family ABC transporter substrate-binding protein n=1 Tax=Pararobbsia alpina TaxID=621374 RepID=UPI0039A63765
MKHTLSRLLSTLALSALAASSVYAEETLSVAASPTPHAEILEHIKPVLKKEGVDLQVRVFTDYIQPNLQVEEKRIDVNYFQHQPYLDAFNKNHHTHLISVAPVHVEPFGAYSHKVKSASELKDGAVVAIPNDPSNVGRSLLLLQKNGLIKLKDPTNILETPHDIVDNPKHLEIKELEAATLPRVLDQVDLALINTNYALDAHLVPTKDALFIEDSQSPYANLIVARQDNANSDAVKKLVAALQTPDVRAFIEQKYKGAVVPAF